MSNSFKYNKEIKNRYGENEDEYMKTIKQLSKGKRIITAICLAITTFIGLIDLQSYPPDIIVYGADPRDNLRDLYVGDVSGDNVSDLIIGFRDADGFKDTKKDGGGVFVINGGKR